jgi:hypothetical protein
MDWYLSELEASRRHHDLVEEAQADRLLHPSVPGSGRGRRTRNRALRWLGSRMVESGRRLQTQYEYRQYR